MNSSKTALSTRICCLMLRITKNINTHRCHSIFAERNASIFRQANRSCHSVQSEESLFCVVMRSFTYVQDDKFANNVNIGATAILLPFLSTQELSAVQHNPAAVAHIQRIHTEGEVLYIILGCKTVCTDSLTIQVYDFDALGSSERRWQREYTATRQFTACRHTHHYRCTFNTVCIDCGYRQSKTLEATALPTIS